MLCHGRGASLGWAKEHRQWIATDPGHPINPMGDPGVYPTRFSGGRGIGGGGGIGSVYPGGCGIGGGGYMSPPGGMGIGGGGARCTARLTFAFR